MSSSAKVCCIVSFVLVVDATITTDYSTLSVNIALRYPPSPELAAGCSNEIYLFMYDKHRQLLTVCKCQQLRLADGNILTQLAQKWLLYTHYCNKVFDVMTGTRVGFLLLKIMAYKKRQRTKLF